VIALLALLGGGCQSAGPAPVRAGGGGEPTLASQLVRDEDGAEDKTEFWYQLARRPVATNDDAFHALLLYLDGDDPAAGYAGRVRLLKQRRMLAANFDEPAAAPVQRGTLAAALVGPLGIRGGLTMQLLGTSPRYATRAMEYRGLYPAGTPNQAFSGAELVGVIGRVEDYQRIVNPTDKPAAMLPGETAMPDAGTLAPRVGAADDDGNAGAPPAAADMPRDITRPVMLSIARSSAWWQDAAAEPVEDAAAEGPGEPAEPTEAAPRPTTRRATRASTRPTTRPTTVPTKGRPVKLKVIVTGVEGDQAQVRKTPKDPWVAAKTGMILGEAAEFRTGAKSAIRMFIPPNQVYTVDRQTSGTVLAAYYDGQKVKTDVGMEQGRIRLDVERITQRDPDTDGGDEDDVPVYEIEEGGVEHDSTIRSPNTALAVRGTRVSLYDQAPFTPEAVSLTGRAEFQNTRRQLVAFGGTGKARVRGGQASAAEHALSASLIPANADVARNDFEAQETAELVSRGGFVRGDVLVGNSAGLPSVFPGDLSFVLNWTGGPERRLNDLNLAVFGPDSVNGAFDFVANPPFALSLDPNSLASQDLRRNSGLIPAQDPARPQAFYPRESRTGGRIGRNHVGPEGREIAFWPGTYPTGTYNVQVFNLRDPADQRPPTGDPVPFTVQVFQRTGGAVQPVGAPITGAVRELESSPQVPVRVTEPSGGRALRGRGR
jgi:hypothetical protein